ncbi:helix-turn-helix transcriptional regulator [Adlercreutzia equolifaciens]|uniref:helix-turn-helix transcriptional regulator n=1 Tax=Adlercreutzia equolifaciens TaxID=446660 RepID=UPI0003898315|nr:helix-turn-helix transcriptional regulator [Adlercreutzia equolifaciens]RFT83966.1 LuxR family transcriptional regulator [Adlercreutzia equolifaciens]BAN76331.1 ATP-dependent transcriptional regulator [Adlercreutzia equolifaciens DSM 19450]
MLKRFGDNQEAFASNSELAPTRLGMTIEEQWPALKLVGFGFYYAWIWVSYNSNVLVFPSAASDLPPDTISLTYLVSTLALGVALVLLSLVRPLTRRLVGSNLLLIAVAVVVGAATVGTYASSSLGADANLYLIVSAALTGAGTSVIVLRFGVVYSKAPAREAAMYTAASFVFAAMIYFMAVGLPDPVGMVFTALLPVLAVVSTLTNPEWSDEGEGGRPEGPVPLRRFFVRLLVAVAVFSVVVGVSRGFSVPHSSISSLNADGALIIFSTAVVAGVLFVVVGLLRRQFDVSRLYYPIIIAVAAGILVTPLLGGTGFGSQFITVAYNCFVLVIWCLLAYVAYSSRLSPILVFGLGRGASALGTTFGWLAGLEIVRSQGDGSLSLEVISVAMVFALLVVSMLVLNDRLIGDALRPEERIRGDAAEVPAQGAGSAGEAAFADRRGAEDRRSAADGEGAWDGGTGRSGASEMGEVGEMGGAGASLADGSPGGAAAGERRSGPYRMRCDAVAEHYGLSPRERDVFDLLVRGRSIDYIAQNLTISFNTAKSHIRHIYVKTDVHSRQELIDLIDRER